MKKTQKILHCSPYPKKTSLVTHDNSYNKAQGWEAKNIKHVSLNVVGQLRFAFCL